MTDDMTPQPIQAGPPTKEAPGTQVTILVPGKPTAPAVLDAALNIIIKAMLDDGWDVTAVSAVIYQQTQAVLQGHMGQPQ